MSQAVQKILDQIGQLNPAERDELWCCVGMPIYDESSGCLGRRPDLDFPSIVTSPGVCGGEPRLIRTRIPVWTLEQMRRLGVSEGDILRSYPSLRAVDLVQAWAFADRHRDEIEKAIAENERE